MFLLSASKKEFSSKEIQKKLGLKRYKPLWAMVYKLRKAIGNREDRYTLEGMIELDEAYFAIKAFEIEKSKGIRGKGAKVKSNVAIMAESTPLENIETVEVSNHCRYFKAKVLSNQKSDEVNKTIQESIDNKRIVFTDKSTSYVNISDYVELHFTEKSNEKTTKGTLIQNYFYFYQ